MKTLGSASQVLEIADQPCSQGYPMYMLKQGASDTAVTFVYLQFLHTFYTSAFYLKNEREEFHPHFTQREER